MCRSILIALLLPITGFSADVFELTKTIAMPNVEGVAASGRRRHRGG